MLINQTKRTLNIPDSEKIILISDSYKSLKNQKFDELYYIYSNNNDLKKALKHNPRVIFSTNEELVEITKVSSETGLEIQVYDFGTIKPPKITKIIKIDEESELYVFDDLLMFLENVNIPVIIYSTMFSGKYDGFEIKKIQRIFNERTIFLLNTLKIPDSLSCIKKISIEVNKTQADKLLK